MKKMLCFLLLTICCSNSFANSEVLISTCNDATNKLNLKIYHQLSNNNAGYIIRDYQENFRASGEFSKPLSFYFEPLGFFAVLYNWANEPADEGVSIAIADVKSLDEVTLGTVAGSGEGIFNYGDEVSSEFQTDSCQIEKTQSYCSNIEDAINGAFCDGIAKASVSNDCDLTAVNTIKSYHNMPTSWAYKNIEVRSNTYFGNGIYEIGYARQNTSGLEMNYVTEYALVFVDKKSNGTCEAYDLVNL